jgi:hypothetical protein
MTNSARATILATIPFRASLPYLLEQYHFSERSVEAPVGAVVATACVSAHADHDNAIANVSCQGDN